MYTSGHFESNTQTPLIQMLTFFFFSLLSLVPQITTNNQKTNPSGKCKLRHYCSRTCQLDDWKAGHKTECGKLLWQHNEALAISIHLKVLEEIQSRPAIPQFCGMVIHMGPGEGGSTSMSSTMSKTDQSVGFNGYMAPWHYANQGPFPEGSTQFGYWRKQHSMAEFMDTLAKKKHLKTEAGSIFGINMPQMLNRGVLVELTSDDLNELEQTGIMSFDAHFINDARVRIEAGCRVFYGCDR